MTKDQIKLGVVTAITKSHLRHLATDESFINQIVDEVWKVDTTPNLGCASTLELIEELNARAKVSAATGEEWPNYKTMNTDSKYSMNEEETTYDGEHSILEHKNDDPCHPGSKTVWNKERQRWECSVCSSSLPPPRAP